MEHSQQKPDVASLRIDSEKKFGDHPRSKAWLWGVVLIVAAASVVGYLILKQAVIPAVQVRTAFARPMSPSQAAAELVATGYVVAQRKAEVASKGTGRLEYLGFEEGDRVQAGETIAALDNEDIRASLELQQANLKRAEVDTLDAGRNYRRQRELLRSGAVTDFELEAAEARYRAALAYVDAMAAAVRVAEVNLDNTYIRAPFSGTVLSKNADVGEIVAPFASSPTSKGSVVTLADMTSLEVEADVSESNIYKVEVGQRCEIVLDAYPAVRYPAYVKKIVPTADRARATVLTKVAFTEIDARVLPEMSARVTFLPNSAQPDSSVQTSALVIPREAVTVRDGGRLVFRVDGGRVSAVAVSIGRDLGTVVEVTGGLEAGDQVVLSPPGKMKTGQKIEVST
ncbi:MAG TPA: efflux RND transporter periplasmic adaptor subunit [Acidobacteriota bacterium]|nr:efflux RND transporter periplasmic adaptor subunit [Acidobacteriota bacterium]